jgi:hypothetical protein
MKFNILERLIVIASIVAIIAMFYEIRAESCFNTDKQEWIEFEWLDESKDLQWVNAYSKGNGFIFVYPVAHVDLDAESQTLYKSWNCEFPSIYK